MFILTLFSAAAGRCFIPVHKAVIKTIEPLLIEWAKIHFNIKFIWTLCRIHIHTGSNNNCEKNCQKFLQIPWKQQSFIWREHPVVWFVHSSLCTPLSSVIYCDHKTACASCCLVMLRLNTAKKKKCYYVLKINTEVVKRKQRIWKVWGACLTCTPCSWCTCPGGFSNYLLIGCLASSSSCCSFTWRFSGCLIQLVVLCDVTSAPHRDDGLAYVANRCLCCSESKMYPL